jgi:hypothetical protein
VTVHFGLFPAALRRRLKKTVFNLLFDRRYLNNARFIHAVSPHETEVGFAGTVCVDRSSLADAARMLRHIPPHTHNDSGATDRSASRIIQHVATGFRETESYGAFSLASLLNTRIGRSRNAAATRWISSHVPSDECPSTKSSSAGPICGIRRTNLRRLESRRFRWPHDSDQPAAERPSEVRGAWSDFRDARSRGQIERNVVCEKPVEVASVDTARFRVIDPQNHLCKFPRGKRAMI